MTGTTTKTRSNHKLAVYYAETYGFRLFPQWFPRNKICACPAGEKCKKPCKHPIPAKDGGANRGFLGASKKPTRLAEFWKCNPRANIGVRTGAASNIVVIDVDTYHPKFTEKKLEALIGKFDTQPFVTTPNGGRHLYFTHPGAKWFISARGHGSELPPGVEIKGDNACVTMPGSVGVNGKLYEWGTEISAATKMPPFPVHLRDLFGAFPITNAECEELADEFGKAEDTTLDALRILNGITKLQETGATYDQVRKKLEKKTGTLTGIAGDRQKLVSIALQHCLGLNTNCTPLEDNEDGSNRMILMMNRCARFGLERDEGIHVGRVIVATHPFPLGSTVATDDGIGKRYDQAIENPTVDFGDLIPTPTKDTPLQNELVFNSRNGATVKSQDTKFLWPNWLPMECLSILAGDPDIGKTFVTMDIAARTTTGVPYPHCKEKRDPLRVIIVNSGEDNAARILVPRLLAAGADMTLIEFMDGVSLKSDPDGEERILDIETMLDRFAIWIKNLPEPRVGLVIFEPLDYFLPDSIDSYKKPEVQRVLTPLNMFADDISAAVLGVLHTRKTKGSKGIDKVMGSRAFVTCCRAGMIMDKSKVETGAVYFKPLKNNMCKKPRSLRFKIANKSIDKEDPIVVWDKESYDLTADQDDDTCDDNRSSKASPMTDAARTAIEELLKDDAALTWIAIMDALKTHTPTTLLAARKELQADEMIERKNVGAKGKKQSLWSLPKF